MDARRSSGFVIAMLLAAVVLAVPGCGDDPTPTAPANPSATTLVAPYVRGIITDVPSGAPVAGIAVLLVDTGTLAVVAGPASTDTAGVFLFAPAPLGEYFVVALLKVHMMFDRSAERVSVTRRSTFDVRVRVQRSVFFGVPGYHIEGIVRDRQTMQPVARAFVSQVFGSSRFLADGFALPYETVTDTQGRFRIQDAMVIRDPFDPFESPGELAAVTVVKPGHAPYLGPKLPLADLVDSTASIEVWLDPPAAVGSLSGRILLDGRPLEGAQVGLDIVDRSVLEKGAGGRIDPPALPEGALLGHVSRTNAAGRYRFEGLPAAYYMVRPAFAADDGYVFPFVREALIELGLDESRELPDLSVVDALQAQSPAPRTFVTEPRPPFAWTAHPRADRYRLWVSPSPDRNVLFVELTSAAPVYPFAASLVPGSFLRWHVEALDGNTLVGDFEETATFEVDAGTPPAP